MQILSFTSKGKRIDMSVEFLRKYGTATSGRFPKGGGQAEARINREEKDWLESGKLNTDSYNNVSYKAKVARDAIDRFLHSKGTGEIVRRLQERIGLNILATVK